MSHEIKNPFFERSRDLSNKNDSRYQTLRLVVTPITAEAAVVGLIVTDVKMRTLADTRLHIGRISLLDVDGLRVFNRVILQRAVELI